jgi:hypothetical protein
MECEPLRYHLRCVVCDSPIVHLSAGTDSLEKWYKEKAWPCNLCGMIRPHVLKKHRMFSIKDIEMAEEEWKRYHSKGKATRSK